MSARTARNIIGRRVVVKIAADFYEGTVIDKTEANHAKRIRLQSKGPLQGNVVQPFQYTIMEYLD